MPEMKTLNGYEVVDAKAREDIEALQNAGHATEEYVDEAIAAIPKPDYTGLATEAYVDNAIDNIPEVDLSKHALKSELPTKVSQLQNDSKFITREEVPETDLSAYAKKSEIPDVSDFITSIPSEYITESELNAKGYLTQHQDISGKADKNHKHTEYLTEHQDISHLAPKSSIPTKVSQLANDSNYLTSIPSTYITEAELEAKNYLTEHQSLAAYATKTFVENTVAENQPNLSGYAKKSDIPDVSDFISEIPSEYVTDSELKAKKYATESYVGEAIAQAQLGGEEVDLSDYAKKTDVPTKTSQLTNDSNFITTIPAEYVTETELNNKGYLTQHQSLDGKADKVHEHTEYANKTHNHSMADITDYVAPEIPEVEPTTFFLDFSAVTSAAQAATEAMVEFANYFKDNNNVSVYMRDSFDSNYYYPAVIQKADTYTFNFLKASVNLNSVAQNSALNWDIIRLTSNDNGATWKYSRIANNSTTIATKTYVDNAVTNIEIPEPDLTGYATETYVDDAIAGIDISGGGTGKETVEIPYNGTTFPTALQDKLKEIWQYGVDGKNILDKYDIYFVQNSGNYRDYHIVNSAMCEGSTTSAGSYKRLRLSAQRNSSNLLTVTYVPYTGTLYLDITENIVERSQLEQLPNWYHANSTDANYCRWNFDSSARMVKLVGRVSGETDYYATFEVASPNDNPIGSYTYYQVPNVLGVKSSENHNTYNYLQVFFSGNYFELQNPDGVNCSDYISPEGMYYMV